MHTPTLSSLHRPSRRTARTAPNAVTARTARTARTATIHRAITTATEAPLAFAVTAAALVIVALVGAVTACTGRLPAGGPPALICAALLAAVSLSEISYPARADRRRRRGVRSSAASLRIRVP